MAWVATAVVAGSALGAGASIYGANKNADSIEDASEQGIAFQNRALSTQLALSRPAAEVGNSALGVLADLFGLDAPSKIDFDDLGAGGGTRAGGVANTAETLDGLTPITGATWKARPVFTDGKGGIYSVRGRNGTIERNGVAYLGQASEGNGLFFEGSFVRDGPGVVDFRDGDFFSGRKANAKQIPIEAPVAQGAQDGAQAGTPSRGLNLEDLVSNNPLIQFQQEQDFKQATRAGAAAGLNQSGGFVDEIGAQAGRRTANGIQDFVLNPLFQLAGFGQQAGAQASNAVGANANNLTNLAANAGEARGSAFQNAGNTVGNLLSDFAGARSVNNRSAINNPNSTPFLFNSQTGAELQGPPRG